MLWAHKSPSPGTESYKLEFNSDAKDDSLAVRVGAKMTTECFAPLLADLWLAELCTLVSWCEHAPDNVDERAIRRAFHLAVLAPPPLQRLSSPRIALDELEEMLEAGAVETAAFAVMGRAASIDLFETHASSTWFASFGFANDAPAYCEAPTAVRALIGAWAAFYGQCNETPALPVKISGDTRSCGTLPMPYAKGEATFYHVSV